MAGAAARPKVNTVHVPVELRALNQWVLWRLEPSPKDPAKLTKVPYRVRRPDVGASSTDPGQWAPYAEAIAALDRETSMSGVGFVVATHSGIAGVDLDHCINDRGTLEPWAAEIVTALDSYTEVTPSGRGIRVFVEARLPPAGRKKGNVEMYDAGRFLTVTGDHWPDAPLAIEPRTEQLAAIHAKYLAPARPQLPMVTDVASEADAVILEQARELSKFRLLYDHGDFRDYPSQSEADLALCSLLVKAGADAGGVDRLMRQSRLMRPKWDERRGAVTYGEQTIGRALDQRADSNGATHTPDEPPPRQAVSLAELLENPRLLDPPEAIVPRIGWRGRSVMIAGREKLGGKSTFMTAAAAAKSRGDRFLGEECTAGSVLMVWLEEHKSDVVQRLVRFHAEPSRIYYLGHLQSATTAGRIEEIQREAKLVGAEVVLLDSFQRFVEGVVSDARSSAEMHPPAQALTDLAHENELAVLFSHHAKKDGSGYRDSTALGAAVDVIAELTTPDEKGDETRRAMTLRGRLPGTRDFEYRFDGDGIVLAHRGDEPLELRVLDVITASPGVSQSALRQVIGGRAKTVDGVIQHLLDHHRIVDHGNVKGRRYYLAESPNPMRDKAGQASALGNNGPQAESSPPSNSLRDKGGQGADAQRDKPNASGAVPLSPYGESQRDKAGTPEASNACAEGCP